MADNEKRYNRQLAAIVLPSVLLLIAAILRLGFSYMTARDTVAAQEQMLASRAAIIDELTEQRDTALRTLAEYATADAPSASYQQVTSKLDAPESVVQIAPLALDASDDVDLLARLIYCEIGSDGHPDEQLYNVGSVVLNRVNDSRFPDTLRDVIYQRGQYAPAASGALNAVTPTERCYSIAADLLANGSTIPADVVWQSGVPQGSETWATFYSSVTGTTMYYCR